MSNPHPIFPFDDERPDDLVDDDDYCIMCNRLLLEHDQVQANECFSALTKRRLFRKELARRA